MTSFLAALRFLTILPVPGSHYLTDEDWGRTTAWYPAVGLLLGAILAALDWGFHQLWSGGVASALVLVAWVALTGALHLDGFVDCCDALLAPVSPERRLEILRDVHAGAFGIAGVFLLLLTKYVALAALPETIRAPALVLVPVLGRWGMTGAVLRYPYARPGSGLGRRAKSGTGNRQMVVATATILVAAGLAWVLGLGWIALLLMFLSAISLLLAGRWIQSRIPGLTGDTYGALCELIEVVNLLALSALGHGGIWL